MRVLRPRAREISWGASMFRGARPSTTNARCEESWCVVLLGAKVPGSLGDVVGFGNREVSAKKSEA